MRVHRYHAQLAYALTKLPAEVRHLHRPVEASRSTTTRCLSPSVSRFLDGDETETRAVDRGLGSRSGEGAELEVVPCADSRTATSAPDPGETSWKLLVVAKRRT